MFLEHQYIRKCKSQTNYLPDSYNYAFLRYICGFFQLSSFLSVLKVAVVSMKASKEWEIEMLLRIITQSGTGVLQYQGQILKYLETYLEALPQTLLQINIILTTKQWVWLQLVSIISGITNINMNSISFEAMCTDVNILDVWKHPVLLLSILSYNGFLLTSLTLIFWQFHWIFATFWIALHVLISYFSKWNKDDFTLIFMTWQCHGIQYWKILNKIWALDNIIIVSFFAV